MTINNGSIITESSSLSNDLNFDEIDLAEFLFEIDDVFLVETDLNFEKFTTMRTVIDFIETNSKLPSNPVPIKENPMMNC
jgi:acyl carrier protein